MPLIPHGPGQIRHPRLACGNGGLPEVKTLPHPRDWIPLEGACALNRHFRRRRPCGGCGPSSSCAAGRSATGPRASTSFQAQERVPRRIPGRGRSALARAHRTARHPVPAWPGLPKGRGARVRTPRRAPILLPGFGDHRPPPMMAMRRAPGMAPFSARIRHRRTVPPASGRGPSERARRSAHGGRRGARPAGRRPPLPAPSCARRQVQDRRSRGSCPRRLILPH